MDVCTLEADIRTTAGHARPQLGQFAASRTLRGAPRGVGQHHAHLAGIRLTMGVYTLVN